MKIKDQQKISERFSFNKCGEQRLVLWHEQPSDCSQLHQLGRGKDAVSAGRDRCGWKQPWPCFQL